MFRKLLPSTSDMVTGIDDLQAIASNALECKNMLMSYCEDKHWAGVHIEVIGRKFGEAELLVASSAASYILAMPQLEERLSIMI